MTIRMGCAWLVVAAVELGACDTDGTGMAVQAVAGPGGVTVTARAAAGELAVSWSADPAATGYQVFQSVDDGPPALAASVFDSGGGPPSTSWIADGLTAGVTYCYRVVTVLEGGSTTAASASVCAAVVGAAVPGDASTTLHLSGHAFVGWRGAPVSYTQVATFSGSALVGASIPVATGATIVGVRVYLTDSTSPASQAIAELGSTTSTGVEVDLGGSQISNGNGAPQALQVGGIAVIATAGTSYWVAVKNASGAGAIAIAGAEIDCL